jgi:fatty acid desaturase
MDAEQKKPKIPWYRSPIDRATLEDLNRRSDWQGLQQALGHLGLLALTAALACYSVGRLPLLAVLVILYLHGTFWAFLLNGFHELVHKSVFKTKALNSIFLYVVSFLGWLNPVLFWASHQEHHKYTLYPPADLEVVLPVRLTLKDFLKVALVNPWGLYGTLKGNIRLSRGRLEGVWENYLFPPEAAANRQKLFQWARILLVGQALLVVVSLLLGFWMLPVVITLAPFYGGGLQWLCNNLQHTGLVDKVPDYRLCCRTILLNPFVRFLYWQMNYHTEHHMYAAVPCYNLGRLHAAIKADLPDSPTGLIAAWKQVIAILQRQKVDPQYQYTQPLPAHTAA